MLHALLVRHRSKGLRTALIFNSTHPSLAQIPQVVPAAEREPFPRGWIVADLWAASIVPVLSADLCEHCAMGHPCAFGRRQEPLLATMGYTAPWSDDLARMAERVPMYGDALAFGIRAFGRVNRGVSALASLAAKIFPAPGMKALRAPAAPPQALAPELRPHAAVLGLVWPFTLADVHRAFLERAPRAHPDHGGTSERIQAVVEARNAFARAWGPRRSAAQQEQRR